MPVYDALSACISNLNTIAIAPDRSSSLEPLVNSLTSALNRDVNPVLNFICTHNSRRSHFTQIWAQTLAHFYGLHQVRCYSGGTEKTALFSEVISTLKKVGFEITTLAETANPIYAIKYSPDEHPIIGFSKCMDHPFNPSEQFIAVMTCSDVNETCPIVPGAVQRIPITYEDPKRFDATPEQAEKYMERCMQIAREMNYVFSKVAHQHGR